MWGTPLVTLALSDGMNSNPMYGAPDARWHMRQWQMALGPARHGLRNELRCKGSRPLKSSGQTLHASPLSSPGG